MNRHLLLATLVTTGLAMPRPAHAQDERGLVWDNRPSIVVGEDINIDLRGRAIFDWRRFDADLEETTYDLRTLRLGLRGNLTSHFDWELEREIDKFADVEEAVDKWRLGEWKEVYGHWTTFDAFSIKFGRFKMPFGLEQNTRVSDLDFAYRTAGSVKIAPARDTGVMAHGELLGGALLYEAGVFDGDGDNGELETERFVLEGATLEDLGPSVALRVVGELFRGLPVNDRLKGAEFGISYTRAHMPEGLNSLFGEDTWGFNYFDRVYVNGTRQRLGLQADWSPGPTGFKAEWMRSREQRLGQSNRNADVSDFIGTGWYTSATIILTGEDKDSDVTPNDPLFGGRDRRGRGRCPLRPVDLRERKQGGTGLHQPARRTPDPEHRHDAHVRRHRMPIRWVKVVANGIRQHFDDVNRVPITGIADYWSGLLRLQIAF